MNDQPGKSPILDAAKLQALLDAADRLTSTLSLDVVLGHILRIGSELTGAEAGSVILHDPARGDLYFAAATGPSAGALPSIRIPVGKGKAGLVFATGESLVENKLTDHFKAVDEKAQFVTRSMVCVPLTFDGRTYGVLQLVNKDRGETDFDASDLELSKRLANQATIALRNATLFERLLASSGLYAQPDVRRDLVPIVMGDGAPASIETATVMFADMRGFSRLCRVLGGKPQAIQDHLKGFFRMMAGSVLIHHGIVNKFLGDGVMALFRGSDSPLRAVQCAFHIRESFTALREEWAMGVSEHIGFLDIGAGIAYGEVIVGAVGDDKVSDFTIIGSAVNLAAALERDAREGRAILCENRVFRAVQPWVVKCEGPIKYAIGKGGGGEGVEYSIYDLKSIRSAIQRETVFVCHAHADIERIRELVVPRLEKAGFDVFLSENSIAIGAKWDKAIGTAIEACDHFLIAISGNAISSPHVGEEIHYAFSNEKGKRADWIMPVLLDLVEPSQIYWQLGRRQYRDVTTPSGIADFEQSLKDLAAQKRAGAAKAQQG